MGLCKEIKSVFKQNFKQNFKQKDPSPARPKLTLNHMPGNVLNDILSKLSKDDRLSLRLTCAKMFTANITFVSQDICIVPYLWHLCRRLPDAWLCSLCHRLHRVSELDTPNEPNLQICTRRPAPIFESAPAYDGIIMCPEDSPYNLGYRHIQSALKWTRLGIREDHVQRLLQVHHSNHVVQVGPRNCRLEAWALPKIVDGKCLLYRVLQYRLAEHSAQQPFWEIRICPHQKYDEGQYETYKEENGPGSRNGLLPNFYVCKVMQAALASPGTQIFSACAQCRTDFVITIEMEHDSETSGNRSHPDAKNDGICSVELSIWQDLGGECSPLEGTWASQFLPLADLARRFMFRHEKPGSVMNTYGEVCCKWDPNGLTKVNKGYERLAKETELLFRERARRRQQFSKYISQLAVRHEPKNLLI